MARTPADTYLTSDAARRRFPVRFLFFILLIILIAQIGFWKTLGAVIGAAAMLVFLAVLMIAVVVVGGLLIAARMR